MQSVDLIAKADNKGKAHRRADNASTPSVTLPDPEARTISRAALINRLNYLHFQSSPLIVVLAHKWNGRILRLQAVPQACLGEDFTFSWVTSVPPTLDRGDFEVRHLEVPCGHHILKVDIIDPQLVLNGLLCRLPAECRQLTSRRTRRHSCTGIVAGVIQNGALFSGTLKDYSAAAFRLELQAKPPQTFQWLKRDEPLTVIFREKGQTLLSVSGQILRSEGSRDRHTVVVAPSHTEQRRFPPKKHRNRRLELRPAPEVIFTHPLTKKLVRLDVADLSGAGMAVTETLREAQLLPGMLIEELELRLADSFVLTCKAQVVYCSRPEDPDEETPVRCGVAILDMDVADHTRLMALLHRADDRKKGICQKVNLDQLWEFFFASGFIYPQKYQSLLGYRDEFKQTYAKLYDSTPQIARHFIYQEKSRIVGHMAMLRQFSNTWLIHHHAADRNHSHVAGMEILQLVGEAVNETQALYSAHMDYVMCFFRPENRFPQRIFGGVAKHYDDSTYCSLDTFDYFQYRKEFDLRWKEGGEWQLTRAGNEDLLDLEAFYLDRSAGLALRSMDLEPGAGDDAALNESYRSAGFQRQRTVYALRRGERTVAIFVLLHTEVGLNLSNLTNAITVFIFDNDEVPREAFFSALCKLAGQFPQEEVPILAYPPDYAASQAIKVEKQYNLWALDCRNLDPYFEFCGRYFDRMQRNGKESRS